jgi:predicted aspartyl protease
MTIRLRHLLRVWSFAVLASGAASPALAAHECGLELVASLDLDPAELPGRAMIGAEIKDTPQKMIIDTGATQTMIDESVVKQFGLLRTDVSAHFRMQDYYGNPIRQGAVIPYLKTGNLMARDVHALILTQHLAAPAAGVIGPDLLMHYEVELDFAKKKMNLFAPDHCPGQLVYWTHDPVVTVPMNIDAFGHIGLDVVLDGKATPAHLDTGAPLSSMTLTNATADFGLTPDSPGMTRKDVEAGTIYLYQFKSLSLGGVAISNPTIFVAGGQQGQVKRDFLLGLRELSKLHVLISYKEKTLYVTAPDAH